MAAKIETRARKALQVVEDLARQLKDMKPEGSRPPTWINLHNATFGIGGIATDLFPLDTDRVAFSRTDEFRRIQEIIQEACAADEGDSSTADILSSANGAISVRLPRSIHAALLAEAKSEGVSLNQLCVAKLCVQLRAKV